jgi:hypothetical protein
MVEKVIIILLHLLISFLHKTTSSIGASGSEEVSTVLW